MTIGFIFAGKMKTLGDQWIETQFFMLGIPLFPIQSMFVTKVEYKSRQGIQIGLHWKSVLKGYLSFWLLGIGVFLTISASIFDSIIGPIAGIVALAASIYFFFIYGKSTEEENEERMLFQNAVGLNALPEYLNPEAAMILKQRVLGLIKGSLGVEDFNWIEMVEKDTFDSELLPLLFAVTGYHCRIEQNEKFCHLFNNLKQRYKQQLVLQPA